MNQGPILAATFSILSGLLPWPACAALSFGAYQTPPDATVEEWGDMVTNRSRVVPIFATLTFDLSTNGPSLVAVIANAVLEGRDPFALTVRSLSGGQFADGTYWFRGDYLREIYPSGTQYGFDWKFSTSTNGEVVWNGSVSWWGGHIWEAAISNITLVAVPWLSISPVGTESVQILWATNFANHVLEHTASLSAADWGTVTNAVITVGDRRSVTVDTYPTIRFFRLRKP